MVLKILVNEINGCSLPFLNSKYVKWVERSSQTSILGLVIWFLIFPSNTLVYKFKNQFFLHVMFEVQHRRYSRIFKLALSALEVGKRALNHPVKLSISLSRTIAIFQVIHFWENDESVQIFRVEKYWQLEVSTV
jgi:hypothetical protein